MGSGYIRVRLDQKLEVTVEKQFSSSAQLAAEAITSIRTISLLTLEGPVLQEYSMCLDSIVTGVVRNLVSTAVPTDLDGQLLTNWLDRNASAVRLLTGS